jgi:predicted SAM-dependent methyltransferase
MDKHVWGEKFDAVVCSHMLEHLPVTKVVKMLQMLREPLKPNGTVTVLVPDIMFAAKAIVNSGTTGAVLYKTAQGHRITALDMMYGWNAVTDGRESMRHKTAFTVNDLAAAAVAAGVKIDLLRNVEETQEVMLRYR